MQSEFAMVELRKRALAGVVIFQLVMTVFIFGPALTLNYWQGWLFWFVFLACITSNTLYFLHYDPALVARRMKAGPLAEKEPKQRLIQLSASIFLCVTLM